MATSGLPILADKISGCGTQAEKVQDSSPKADAGH